MGKIIRNGIVYAGSPNVEVIDAYTKTESDNRFASKSIYGDSSIKINSYGYNMVVGYLNTIPAFGSQQVVIGDGNTVGNYAMNYKIIGDSNTMYVDSSRNILIGNYIYENTLDDYDVVIGYLTKGMIVKENGDVISRGDVICDDGNGNRISLRDIKTTLDGLANIHIKEYTFNKNYPVTVPIRLHVSYSYMIIGGFLQGIGGALIGITFNAGAIGTIKDLHNGTTFSSSYISFEKSGNNLLIKSTTDANSFITVFQL